MSDEYPCGMSKEELPTVEMCLSFLAEENVPNNVIDHCMAVEKLALQIAMKTTDDRNTLDLVSRAALLHDIGRGKSHGIDHAVAGAEILRKRELDPRIISIVEKHIGGGIAQSEAVDLGLPEKDYMPETLAEKVVAHADNLITGHGRWTVPPRNARDRGREAQGRAPTVVLRQGCDPRSSQAVECERRRGEDLRVHRPRRRWALGASASHDNEHGCGAWSHHLPVSERPRDPGVHRRPHDHRICAWLDVSKRKVAMLVCHYIRRRAG